MGSEMCIRDRTSPAPFGQDASEATTESPAVAQVQLDTTPTTTPTPEPAAAEPVSAEAVEAEIVQSITELNDEVSEVVADVTPPTQNNAPAAAKGPLVLAVDDSPTIRKLVAMTLEREGFEVITAADGLEALQLLSEHMPDIILSDVNMPRLDGYKLCRFVKKHDRTKHIPVVMLSGKDGVFDKLRGKMFGCGDYITKPFETADLVEKVRLHTGVYSS